MSFSLYHVHVYHIYENKELLPFCDMRDVKIKAVTVTELFCDNNKCVCIALY